MNTSRFVFVVALGITVPFAVQAQEYFRGTPKKDSLVEALTPDPGPKMRSLQGDVR